MALCLSSPNTRLAGPHRQGLPKTGQDHITPLILHWEFSPWPRVRGGLHKHNELDLCPTGDGHLRGQGSKPPPPQMTGHTSSVVIQSDEGWMGLGAGEGWLTTWDPHVGAFSRRPGLDGGSRGNRIPEGGNTVESADYWGGERFERRVPSVPV